MTRTCASCGRPFEATSHRATYCGPTCRKRASRGAVVTDIAERRPGPTKATGLVLAVTAELEEAERLETAMGQTALALAVRLESGVDTGSAVAALTRELRATMEAATAGARAVGSPLQQMRDELAERRRVRGA
jgi:hypothetical protein